MSRRYIRDTWEAKTQPVIEKGAYVLATKYRDGDPADGFCVGFFDQRYNHCGSIRNLVVDSEGRQFRGNGFRRVARISRRRGEWIAENLRLIESNGERYSVWHWHRAPWSELNLPGKKP